MKSVLVCPVMVVTILVRCIAIVAPLKRMDWMTASAARRRVIPITMATVLLYSSYKAFAVTRADPGILACNSIAGTSLFVS